MAKSAARTPKEAAPKRSPARTSKYLLSIPEDLRREIRIEAITLGIDMSTYICSILRKRPG